MIEFKFGEEVIGVERPNYVPAEPDFHADREVGERIARLRATFGGACMTVRLLSSSYQRAWDGAIVSLTDDKGTLQVVWRDRESRIMFEGVIMGAWEANGDHAGLHLLG